RRTGTDRSAMLKPPAQLIEDRLGAFGVCRLRTHQTQQLSLARRRGRSTDRTLHHRRTLSADLGSKRERHLRRHRAHFNEQLALCVARQKSLRTIVDGIDRGGVGKHGNRGLYGTRQIGWGRRQLGASIRPRLWSFRGGVSHPPPISPF